MLDSANIASNILNIIGYALDKSMGDAQLADSKAFLDITLNDLQFLNTKATLDGYTIIRRAIPELQSYMPQMFDIMAYATYAGRTGNGYTATMANLKLKMFTQSNLIDMNNQICWELPAQIVKTKAMHWYMSAYRPSIPSEELAIQQFIRGHITTAKCAEYLAFHGVPDDMAMMIYDTFENYPSIREMALASQFADVTDAFIQDNFKFNNITLQPNKEFYMKYAHAIQLRQELNQYLIILRQDYADGLITDAEFASELSAHKPNANEQTQIITNSKATKARALLRMEITTQTYLYRTKVDYAIGHALNPVKTAEQIFYEALIALSVDASIANGIVRLEASKLGISWERV